MFLRSVDHGDFSNDDPLIKLVYLAKVTDAPLIIVSVSVQYFGHS